MVLANLLAYRCSKSAGRIMNIGGGGDEVSIEELARLVMRTCRCEVSLVHGDPKPGDIRRLVSDNSLAREVMGYQPSVSLEAGLREYVEYAKGLQTSRDTKTNR